MRKATTFSVAFVVVGCGSNTPDTDTIPESSFTTYHQTIKPILDAKCVGCHVDGGIAPFALTDYSLASEYAVAAAGAVTSQRMPPWAPSSDCREYVGDRSLDPSQIDAINRWVADGMPEGDPATPGAALPDTVPKLSRVDVTLAIPEPYTPRPAAGKADDYRCFVVPWPSTLTQTTFVTGFGAAPDDTAEVHHIIAFLAGPDDVATFHTLDADDPGPGYTCFGGANGPVSGMIGGWAPGSLGSDLPPGIGLPVEAGSAIILQVHYNLHDGAARADQSSIQFKVDDTVERPGRVLPFTNPLWVRGAMPIAAGDPDASYAFEVDPTPFTGELEVFSAALHMHQLGTRARAEIHRGDAGESRCLLSIEDWDFHWQGSYGFQRSEILRTGDKLSINCHWDNTAANHDGGAPIDVNWGEGTADEMCLGFFLTAAPQ